MQRKYLYVLIAVLIVAVVAVLLLVAPGSGSSSLARLADTPVPQSLIAKLAVPDNVSNNIGLGSAGYGLHAVNGSKIAVHGKPAIIYIGADYCPYCAVTRWPLIIALSRFGSFSNLHYMTSDPSDVYPNTPTFTFHNSTYASQYVSFVSVETLTQKRQTLEMPNQSEQNLLQQYDPTGGIPFIDFGNMSVQLGTLISPAVLSNSDWNSTAANLTNPGSVQAQAIVGSADLYTAQICQMTNMTPSSVCNQGYISKIIASGKA